MLVSTLACLSLVMGLYSAPLALAGLVVLGSGLMITDHVPTVLVLLVTVMPLDLKIDVGSQSAFLDLVPGILAIPLLRKLFSKSHDVNLRPLMLLGFVVMAVLTTVNRSDKAVWLWESGLRLTIVLIFASAIASFGDAEKIILAAGWSLVPAVGYGMYQLAIGGLGPLFSLFSGVSESRDAEWFWTGRPYSTFGHPNDFGFYCAIISAMILTLALKSQDRFRRKMAFGLSFVGLIGVLSSNSRGAWMGLAAVVAILTIMGCLRARYLVVGIVLVIAAFVALTVFNPAGSGHAGEFGDESVGARMQLWTAAIRMFVSHPITGVGWMNFTGQATSFIDWRDDPPAHAHNIYLSFLAETGIVGFLLFFVPIAVVMKKSAKVARSSTACLAGLLGIVVFLVQGLVEVTIEAPQTMLVFGVALGLACRSRFGSQSWNPHAFRGTNRGETWRQASELR
jgi:O-antigen ligase